MAEPMATAALLAARDVLRAMLPDLSPLSARAKQVREVLVLIEALEIEPKEESGG